MNEISCRITSTFLHYIRNTNPKFIKPLLDGLPYDKAYLSDTDNWISWDVERILEERLVQLFNDELIMFKIGRSVITLKSLGLLNAVFNLFVTPERLIRYTPLIARYFTKDVVHINVIETTKESAKIELKIKGRQTRGACLFNQGMFSLASELFGLGATTVSEIQCVVPVNELGSVNNKFYSIDDKGRVLESDPHGMNCKILGHVSGTGTFRLNETLFGAESCIYRLKWKNRRSKFIGKTIRKKQALQDAMHHLEESHAKLERAYERIYKSEEKYRELMENASDIICFLDPDGIITSLNKKGLEIFGYAPRAVIGRDFSSLVDNQYREEFLFKFGESLKGITAVFELVIKTKNGRPAVLSINSTPIREESNIAGIMFIARDITMEREMANRLLEAERFAAKGIVAAEIAHEINNSLANIETALFIINNIRIDRQYREDVLKDVYEEIERMSGIVKSILEVYRSDDSVIQSVDINAEITKVINMAQRRLKGKGISVISRLLPNLSCIPCYPGHIKQILLNLIKNSEEAMDSNRTNLIEISTVEDGNFVKINVTDTGCGIPEEKIKEIFSPLVTSKAEGTGLGLSICQEIAEKYGGDIKLFSQQGKGTTVVVSLKKE
jgi:PAS domain S-box-containing protein